MESAYRTWVHAVKNNSGMLKPDEIKRDLQTALGTTKWQVLCHFSAYSFELLVYVFWSLVSEAF